MGTTVLPNELVEGYLEEHTVVDESEDLDVIELETPNQHSKQLVYSDKHLKICSSLPTAFQKKTEIWESSPIGPKMMSAMAAAHSVRPRRRRLNFSALSSPPDPDSSIQDHLVPETNEPVEDERELVEQNVDLKKQNLKQADDLKDVVLKLNYAEDRNQWLENQVEKLRNQQDCSNQRTKTAIENYSKQVLEQNEIIQLTKEELRERSLRINRLQKELNDLKLEKEALQAELEKGCSELQWYQTSHAILKKELRMAQDELQLDSVQCDRLEMENAEMSVALQELRLSYEKIQLEKNELEALAKTEISKQGSNGRMNSSCESDDLDGMDSKDMYATAFPLLPAGTSIFAEIQSSLDKPIEGSHLFADVGTQTCEEVPSSFNLKNDTNNPPEVVQELENVDNFSEPADTDNAIGDKNGWTMKQPIDHRKGTISIGAIREEDRERMIQYAYDVPLRSCNPEAAILSRREWRTLHSDLDQVDLERFKKSFGQEEATDESIPFRIAKKTDDLDEFAETYCEQFPFLAETIFENLQCVKPDEGFLDSSYLPQLQKRFEELAVAARTDHEDLERRSEMSLKQHSNVKDRLSQLSTSLKQSVDLIRSHKMPGELRELFNSVEKHTLELDELKEKLDLTAKRTARLDVITRVFKLIEVMVLYVRVLKTHCKDLDDECSLAKKLLWDHGISLPNHQSITGPGLNNNNNDEVVREKHRNSLDYSGKSISPKRSVLKLLQDSMSSKSSDSELASTETTALCGGSEERSWLRSVRKFCEWILMEFNWPWTGEQTWGGFRRCFAIILMAFGVLLICRINVMPCKSSDVESLVTYTHVRPPRT